jgi:hypothetical protein
LLKAWFYRDKRHPEDPIQKQTDSMADPGIRFIRKIVLYFFVVHWQAS